MIKKVAVHDYPNNYAEQRVRELTIKVNEIIDILNKSSHSDENVTEKLP